METISPLPQLPSKRKDRMKSNNNYAAQSLTPTRGGISKLRLTNSEESCIVQNTTFFPLMAISDKIISSGISEHFLNGEDEDTRDDQIKKTFCNASPIPASTSSAQLLSFIHSTNNFTDSFVEQVDSILTKFSKKLENIETKIQLLGIKLELSKDLSLSGSMRRNFVEPRKH